ncbi:PrsW family glutamic-type intramembrane protease [Mastigocoleus sp. MO_188.B34]|uniref:PrsW family intramembrane metalloprotease n=1 Tax=Mastigocoleus sp. MO_188.B34 TaxID=3036635 RepID=UPI002617576C|nr:PrsW family glutamic-type intramembrane protease [Mastigocoleus sp. MO_188.B34]MDJ0693517.1 PrsW family glutamic-type intramembrane protease [Mastigocoleus sp. MO_188.B34]
MNEQKPQPKGYREDDLSKNKQSRKKVSQSGAKSQKLDSNNIIGSVAEGVAKVAGVEQIQGFSLKQMFSEVLKKHSEDEVEEYFTVGTATTTPNIMDVDTNWPKPWVFFRTLCGALIVYLGFIQAWEEFQNINLIPGLIIVGSFVVPFSTLIFFFEINARKNVSLYQVIRLVFLGGILSLIFSLFLFQVSGTLSLNWIGASVAGLVEEPGKLLALILVINISKYRYLLNGLLFGAAVGTGFAAFESAGYALRVGLFSNNVDVMLSLIMLRGMLAPFSHIVWSGMSAAVLWKIKGEREFSFTMLKDPRFLRVFGFAVVLHMVWNSPLELPFYGKYFALGFVSWIIILSLIQDGLKQLRDEKLTAMSIENSQIISEQNLTTETD